jgi:hypothetical protein
MKLLRLFIIFSLLGVYFFSVVQFSPVQAQVSRLQTGLFSTKKTHVISKPWLDLVLVKDFKRQPLPGVPVLLKRLPATIQYPQAERPYPL